MRAYLRDHALSTTLLAVLVVLQGALLLWEGHVCTMPLDVPIELSPPGSVHVEVRVPVPEAYGLELAFQKAGHDFHALNELLGGWSRFDGSSELPGVHVPVRWSLTKASTVELAASGETETHGTTAYTPEEIWCDLADIKIAAGVYVFDARILRDVPELRSVKARLELRLGSDGYSTWQRGLVEWGNLAAMFTLPVSLILALVLARGAIRAIRTR
jgi:hypothetical protein